MTGRVERIQHLQEAMQAQRPFATANLVMHFSRMAGHPVVFCVDRRRDTIQDTHKRGQFYEVEELSLLSRLFPPGLRYLDIGSNVGNHSLYFSIVMKAARVVPVEPNPLAFEMLIANTLANGLSDIICLDHVGVGLSDRRSAGYAMEERRRNLGAAKMLEGGGELETWPGDDLFAEEAPDFLKIDVEGMEMEVLSGLAETIERSQPAIFIEVDDDNAKAFAAWVDEHGYASVYAIRKYRTQVNHLLVPAAEAPAMKRKITENSVEEL